MTVDGRACRALQISIRRKLTVASMAAWALGLLFLLSGTALAARADAGQPSLLMVMLPGGTSHHMQGNAIAQALRARGWRTTTLLPDFDAETLASKGMLPQPGLETIVFRTPPNSNENFQKVLADMQDKPSKFIKVHTAHFEGLCRQVLADAAAMSALRQLAPDLLLLDMAFGCNSVLGEVLGAPRVLLSPVDAADPFWSTFAAVPYTTAVHPFLGSAMAPPLTFAERVLNTLMSPLVFALGSVTSRASAQRLIQDFNLTTGGASSPDFVRGSRMVLLNMAPGVSVPRSLPPNVKAVGPLLVSGEPKPLPEPLKSVVEAAGPTGVVYVSFGTTFRPSCDVLAGLTGALAALDHTVVLNINPAHLPATCPLDPLPPSVHVVPWVPQADLLGHPNIRVFVSHGGINSLFEAAYRGKPMVCVPLAGDQFDGCAKAARGGWGLTLRASDLSSGSAHKLASLIKQAAAAGSPLQNRAAIVSATMRAHPRSGLERAADWIEFALALPEGADLRDPAMLLPWWQRLCLDVYAVVAAALALVLGGAVLLVRALWRAAKLRLMAAGAKKQD